MPKYRKGKGKLVHRARKPRFKHVTHMSHWLTKTSVKNPLWQKHIVEAAKNYKSDKYYFHPRTLKAIQEKHPVHLAGDVLGELKKVNKGQNVGGGITEALHFFADMASNAIGLPAFQEWIGNGYEHKKIPREQRLFAKALDETYTNISDRPDKIGPLTRLPEYDTDRYSVWNQGNGQLLVTIHGSKLTLHDIVDDVGIIIGAQQTDSDVQKLFNKLDSEGKTYDIASHSLATQYVVNAEHKNSDSIYLFNPASSPFQDVDYLKEQANNDDYTFFINPSDAVSNALWQQMDWNTVDNSYIGNYMWSPIASHQMGQWFEGLDDELEHEAAESERIRKAYDETTEERASYKTHLLGKLRSDNRSREAEKEEVEEETE